MKKKLLLGALLMSGMLFLGACDDDENPKGNGSENVPQKVLAAFEKEYGDAPVTWELKGDYAVANLTRTGETAWFEVSTALCGLKEQDVPFAQLPVAVKTAFEASGYKTWKVDDVDKLVRKDSETLYVIEAEQGEKEVDLYYTEAGVLMHEIFDVEDNDYESYFPQTPDTDVTAWVKEHLGADAKIVEYDKKRNHFEVDVVADGLKVEVLFSANMEWLQTKTEFDEHHLSEVPAEVLNAAKAEKPGAVVEEVEKILTGSGEFYCVEMEEPNDREYKVFVDAETLLVIDHPALPEDELRG